MIEEIKRLAQTAGREINSIYRSQAWTVSVKQDASPVTEADIRANEIIVRGLNKLSSDPVISEEGATELASGHSRFWLVDPLDGTRDFVARRDTFVVCIALIENNEPILGVIHSPVTDELWWAVKAEGSFGPSGRLMNERTTTSQLSAVGSRSVPSESMQALLEEFQVSSVDRFGSALKFCKMAEGRYDLYPRLGPTMEWDTAAGQIIAEEAACQVLDLSTGARLQYAKPGLMNGGFICSRANIDLDPLLASLKL